MIQKINNHIVKCGDILDGIDDLMQNDKADFIYSDPPWGQGNLKYWQTMNFKMNNVERREIDYNHFINQLFSILSKYAKDKVLIEYGERWKDDIVAMCQKFGFIHNAVTTGFYNGGRKMLPLDFHFLSRSKNYGISENLKEKIRTLSGQKVVHAIFDEWCPKDAKIILDPMCGMGYTAQATVDRNFSFRGNELNKKRLDKTIKRLL
jgi:DNA modification methylase